MSVTNNSKGTSFMKPSYNMDVLSTEVITSSVYYLLMYVLNNLKMYPVRYVNAYKRWQLQVVKLLEIIYQKSDIAINQTNYIHFAVFKPCKAQFLTSAFIV